MRVQRVHDIRQFTALRQPWNALADGNPMRSWEWCRAWWDAYGHNRELYVLTVHTDAGELIGVAPWCRQRQALGARVVQFLGSGDVCSDHLSLLIRRDMVEPVCRGIADWLQRANRPAHAACGALEDQWDLLELVGVDADDRALCQLGTYWANEGHRWHQRPGMSCWAVQLPSSWEDYLGLLSKNQRKNVRRGLKILDDPTSGWLLTQVSTRPEWSQRWPDLRALHTRRRRSLGGKGIFDRPHFDTFLRSAADNLLPAGLLVLNWLTIQGRPAAFEVQLIGTDSIYAYQSGMEPDLAEHSPGSVLFAATIRDAFQRQMRYFDFLRGDEPYKQSWKCTEVPTIEMRMVAPHASARVHHQLWLAASRVKRYLVARAPSIHRSRLLEQQAGVVAEAES